MVECAAEKELPREIEVEPISVITGDNNYKKFLYYQLKMSIRQADAIDIVVSFLMESGVRMLLKDLQAALDRGCDILIGTPGRLLRSAVIGIRIVWIRIILHGTTSLLSAISIRQILQKSHTWAKGLQACFP